MSTIMDILFIILLVVTMSIIIGLGVVNVIDKKIGDVSINIPPTAPIKIPETKIMFNVCEDKKGKININVTKNDNKNNKNNNENNDKNNKNNNENNNVEKFIVEDAQKIHEYRDLKKKWSKKKNSFDSERINYPDKDNIVNYDKDKDDLNFYTGITYDFGPRKLRKIPKERKKAYFSDSDFGWEAPRQVVSCANSSIAQQFKTGEKSLVPNRISCDGPNKLTAENYYKTHYKAQVVPIEDYKVRGHNYMIYSNSVEPSGIDFRILSQSTRGLPENKSKRHNIPVGTSYGFHNTPAMRMP